MKYAPGMKYYMAPEDGDGDGTPPDNSGGDGDGEDGDLILGKFKDQDALVEGYSQLEAKIGKTDEQLRTDIEAEFTAKAREGVPEAATGYEVKLPDGLIPEGAEFSIDTKDPGYVAAQEWAHTNGLNQGAFNEMMGMYVAAQLGGLPNKAEEMGKLGENAQARVDRVDMWAGKNLSKEAYATIIEHTTDSAMVKAMEEVMKIAKGDVAPRDGGEDDTGDDPLSREELEKMMMDPRYRDPKKRDPEFIKRVEDGFRVLSNPPKAA